MTLLVSWSELEPVQPYLFMVIVGSSIWVGYDAHRLGVRRGQLAGSHLDMGVISWVVSCLLFWIVGFPCYLVARGRYRALPIERQASGAKGPHISTSGASQNYLGSAPTAVASPVAQQAVQAYAPPVAPPQLSADGRWWWDGYQWTPAADGHHVA